MIEREVPLGVMPVYVRSSFADDLRAELGLDAEVPLVADPADRGVVAERSARRVERRRAAPDERQQPEGPGEPAGEE